MKDNGRDFTETVDELRKLTASGVLGFYTDFEFTEIFAIREGENIAFNVFSILVAVENTSPQNRSPKYLGDRIKLKSLKGWTFGIQRYSRPIGDLTSILERFHESGEWSPSGNRLHVGTLVSLPTQFVPPDGTVFPPLNNVLKNNFWNGSYILELMDPDKKGLQPFFDKPARLQELSEAVQNQIPIRLASLSDRLGNIAVQFPVEVLIASFGKDRATANPLVSVRWHPKAMARPLRAYYETQFDESITGFVGAPIEALETKLSLPDGEGMQRGVLWDDHHQVVIAATGNMSFIDTVVLNIGISDPEPRTFTIADKNGIPKLIRVGIRSSQESQMGRLETDRGVHWTRRRIYRNEAARLAADRRFVQYKPKPGAQDIEHQKALQDVRHLLNQYGKDGAWLWDPYLSADDVLNTLFYCSHHDANLRALTAGYEVPQKTSSHSDAKTSPFLSLRCLRELFQRRKNVPPKPTFSETQRAALIGAKSNLRGLRLEFRVKTGQNGWDFHDRFLIFPVTQSGALAWSLGTSVNSLGKRHHILQQCDDGQLVMDAFSELWDELNAPEHLVWKTP